MVDPLNIVERIGADSFRWLSSDFTRDTRLRDLPDEILTSLAAMDISIRDYGRDDNAITSIALITFAYRLADKAQSALSGPKDMLLVKVLAKAEKRRRRGVVSSREGAYELPLYELITGRVGETIRVMRTMSSRAKGSVPEGPDSSGR